MLVLTANQNRATTSSSLKIEEVEDRPKMVVNGDRTRESVASKSVLSLLSCVAVWTGRCQYPTLHHSGQGEHSSSSKRKRNLQHCVKPKLCEEKLHQKESSIKGRSPPKLKKVECISPSKIPLPGATWEQVEDQGCILCKRSPWAVREVRSKNKNKSHIETKVCFHKHSQCTCHQPSKHQLPLDSRSVQRQTWVQRSKGWPRRDQIPQRLSKLNKEYQTNVSKERIPPSTCRICLSIVASLQMNRCPISLAQRMRNPRKAKMIRIRMR